MSDPAKNAEVEDALSSIRRLVSDDNRSRQDPKPQPGAEDRFVLVPSLRVGDEPPSDSDETATGDPAPLRLASSQRVGPGAENAPFELGEDRRVQSEARTDASLGEMPSGAGRGNPADRRQDAPEDAGHKTFDQKIEALKTALKAPPDEDAAVVPGADFFTTKRTAVSEKANDPINEAATTAGLPAHSVPDLPSTDQQAGAAAEAPNRTREHIIDEDALRALISETVRTELDRMLGAGNNRNLRKLVRREIYRALAAQDLD